MTMKGPTLTLLSIILTMIIAIPVTSHAETYWQRGMWIGALSGAAVVSGTLIGAVAANECDSQESDLQLCRDEPVSYFIVGLGGAGLGALLGTGIGAAVGSAFKKKDDARAPRTYAGRGMWIGAATGAALGGLWAGISTSLVTSDAAGLALYTAASAGIGGLLGMGIGAGIGSLFERHQSQALFTPYVIPNSHGGLTGGMNISVVSF